MPRRHAQGTVFNLPGLVAHSNCVQPRFHRRLILRPAHHAGVLEGALVEGPTRRNRRAEVALDRLEGPWLRETEKLFERALAV
jgi:hypothetical protein